MLNCTVPVLNDMLQLTSFSLARVNVTGKLKITPLSVHLPHCLATHLSASDSLRPWRYTDLLTYLLISLNEDVMSMPIRPLAAIYEINHSLID